MLSSGGASVGNCTSGALCPGGSGWLYMFPVPLLLPPFPFGLEDLVLFPEPAVLPVCLLDDGLLLLSSACLGLPGISFAFSLSAHAVSRL